MYHYELVACDMRPYYPAGTYTQYYEIHLILFEFIRFTCIIRNIVIRSSLDDVCDAIKDNAYCIDCLIPNALGASTVVHRFNSSAHFQQLYPEYFI